MSVKNMTKISVYGGTGFIGGAFCNLFSDKVIKVSREERTPPSEDILYFISTTTNYNVFDSLTLDINTNLNILMEVLSYCKSSNITFNYVSSGFVYGNDIIDAKETDIPDPRGFYSITKRAAEQLIISFCETFECKYRIFRLANVYGTDKTISSKKNALGFLINKLKNNEDIQMYDGGKVLRDYMHVDDYCLAIMHLIENSKTNEIYNIASGQPWVFYDIIDIAKEFLKSESSILSIDPPKFYSKVQAKNFTLSIDKLKDTRFISNKSLVMGIYEMCKN
jgi:nucleoside-diphosphate-sugar epimerase